MATSLSGGDYVLSSFATLEAPLPTAGRRRRPRASLDPSRRASTTSCTQGNASIQKEREDDAQHNPHVDSEGGTKCSLAAVRQKLAAAGVDVSLLWGRIVELVLPLGRGAYCAAPANLLVKFGDVLIDEHLKPWLIEVNASPSLARDNVPVVKEG